MGLDAHVLQFCKYVGKKKTFGDTITIGRQGVHVVRSLLGRILENPDDPKEKKFCEPLLQKYFGATSVVSIDYSDYENATLIHDLNREIPESLQGRFDTVLDAGTLEHIYQIPQALRNISLFLRPGGQILHALPANNFCGHGFWQFSPELFLSLYSETNGYAETEVFLADLGDIERVYQVRKPSQGKRVNVLSCRELYVLVRTVLTKSNFTHHHVQQSDYLHLWEQDHKSTQNNEFNRSRPSNDWLEQLKNLRPLYRAYLNLKQYKLFYKLSYDLLLVSKRSADRLSKRNPWLKSKYWEDLSHNPE